MGGEASSRGLARYRSAPATWLEALLESDIDEENNNNNNLVLNKQQPQLSPDMFEEDEDNNNNVVFRQNSTPADFGSDDSYFSTYQLIGPSSSSASNAAAAVGCNYDFTPSPSSFTKRPRVDAFSSQLKEEDQSEQLERGLSGLLDPEMEKLLEDSVPCRVRAKRGCATHPRSIAERVRRTRISDRIRKLQELVPNMEKISAVATLRQTLRCRQNA